MNQPAFHVSCSMSLKLCFSKFTAWKFQPIPSHFTISGTFFSPTCFEATLAAIDSATTFVGSGKACEFGFAFDVFVRGGNVRKNQTLGKLDGQHFHQVLGGGIETLITKVVENPYFSDF